MNDNGPLEAFLFICFFVVIFFLGVWLGSISNISHYEKLLLENKLGEWKIQDESSGETEFVIFTRREIESEFEEKFREEIEEELARQLIKDVNLDSSYLLEWKNGIGPLLQYLGDSEDLDDSKDLEDSEELEDLEDIEIGEQSNKGIDDES